MTRTVLRLISALALLGAAGCRSPEESPPGKAPPGGTDSREPSTSAEGRKDTAEASRSEVGRSLESEYGMLESSLDSLWQDSLDVRSDMREQYRRILREARTVKDNSKVYLDELLVSTQGVTPEIWEEIRARTEMSLDSLRRLLISADSAHGRRPAEPSPDSR